MSDHKREKPAKGLTGDDVQKKTKDQKPKQATGAVGKVPQTSTKSDKEEKKKQKAERRAQKKAETGKTSQSGFGPGGDSGLRKDVGGQRQTNPGTTTSEQGKTQPSIRKQLREKSVSCSEDSKKVQLFSHLHQYEKDKLMPKSFWNQSSGLPSSLLRLATFYSNGVICGSNARCLAMLGTFKLIIQDYSTPPQKHLSRDLEHTIKPYISFLTTSRPLSVSMGNAIKWLKHGITDIPLDTPEKEAKNRLCGKIDEYIHEKIILADKAISESCRRGIIKDGDVILIYAYSSIVTKSLIDAHQEGIRFKVIVVDSRPKMEGQHSLRKLTDVGIPCSYIFINAVSYLMKEVSKVLVGAHAVLANGYVMSRVGTSMIAMVARSYNVPVLVCCETYKFCEKVQTDAFVMNELGDPNDLVSINRRHGNILSNWKSLPSLGLLNLAYDVTAPEFVAMVITEVGNLPCTSVPVVLRLT